MGEKKRNWLLLAVTILVTLLVLEGVLRIAGIPKKNARFVCFHPLMGKVYCASTAGTYTKATYRRHLVINPDGMVDAEYPVARTEGTLRVALLGDSFTASEYLPTEDKFEGLLEQDLSRRLGKPVEILNFGISGSETWDQLQLFHLRAARYRPDLTLLVFFWGNDIRNNIERLQSGSPNPLLEEYDAPLSGRVKEVRKNINKALWNNSLLYQVVHDGTGKLEYLVKRWLQPDYLDRLKGGEQQGADPGVLTPAADTAVNEDDLFFWTSAGWNITRELIIKLDAEVRAAGSRLVVLHFPSEELVLSGIPLPHQEFDAFLDQHGIPHVSLFRGYHALEPGELRRHFIPDDGHWTRHGHRYVARQIQPLLFNALSGL